MPDTAATPPPLRRGGAIAPEAESLYTRRALYYTPTNSFSFKLPAVPRHLFVTERDRAFDPTTPTGLVPLDLSAALELDYPATTPNLLARYAVLRAGETLTCRLKASGEVYYAIAGAGETTKGGDRIRWKAGDLFCLPGGGAETVHRAADSVDALLYFCTDEPALAFSRLEPPAPGNAAVEAAHFPAEEIEAHIAAVYARETADKDLSGKAVLFTSDPVQRMRTVLPMMAAAINTLEPGGDQRPHRHNAVAITLSIEGGGCYSMISGERIDWQPYAAMVTPPTEIHSHHNRGDRMMRCLIFQDAGLHYYCRTTGFSFEETATSG
jgi:gentisate 1,2-dioxygenase